MLGTRKPEAARDVVSCRQCGNKLGLLQRLSGQEFCSAAHRELYLREQEELALACLQEARAASEQAPPPVTALPDAAGLEAPPTAGEGECPPEAGFLSQGSSVGPFNPALDAEAVEPDLSAPVEVVLGGSGLSVSRIDFPPDETGYLAGMDPRGADAALAPGEPDWVPAPPVARMARFAGPTVFDAASTGEPGCEPGEACPIEAPVAPAVPVFPSLWARAPAGSPSSDPPGPVELAVARWTAGFGERPLACLTPAVPASRGLLRFIVEPQAPAWVALLEPLSCAFGAREEAWQPEL